MESPVCFRIWDLENVDTSKASSASLVVASDALSFSNITPLSRILWHNLFCAAPRSSLARVTWFIARSIGDMADRYEASVENGNSMDAGNLGPVSINRSPLGWFWYPTPSSRCPIQIVCVPGLRGISATLK